MSSLIQTINMDNFKDRGTIIEVTMKETIQQLFMWSEKIIAKGISSFAIINITLGQVESIIANTIQTVNCTIVGVIFNNFLLCSKCGKCIIYTHKDYNCVQSSYINNLSFALLKDKSNFIVLRGAGYKTIKIEEYSISSLKDFSL